MKIATFWGGFFNFLWAKKNIKCFWKVFYIGLKYTTDLFRNKSIIHRGPPSIISGRISGVMCNVPEVSTK